MFESFTSRLRAARRLSTLPSELEHFRVLAVFANTLHQVSARPERKPAVLENPAGLIHTPPFPPAVPRAPAVSNLRDRSSVAQRTFPASGTPGAAQTRSAARAPQTRCARGFAPFA